MIEEQKRIIRLEAVLGHLIAWLHRELGDESCKLLLDTLHSEEFNGDILTNHHCRLFKNGEQG